MRALAPINNSKIPDPKESLVGVRKGAWSEEEDNLLRDCIGKFGEGKWHLIPRRAGLNRCRKSCRLRWLNYLKPDIKRGHFAADEMDLIMRMHRLLGNKWSLIAGRIPGRTANDVKNYWNTHIRKKDMSSCKKQKQEKEQQQQQITKTNIIKPRPRSFSKTTSTTHPHFLSGELAPISKYCNGAVPSPNDTRFRNEVTSETEAAVPQISDNEINSTWWETLLNDDVDVDVDVVDRDIINCNTINMMINYWKSTGLLGEDADTSITNPTGDNILLDQNVVTSWPPF